MKSQAIPVRLVSVGEGWEIKVVLEDEIIIGRQDPEREIRPHVDLNDYGGLEKGISRRHLRLFRKGQEVFAEDLGSVNGSFLNNRRLLSFVPEPVHSGDELRLGGEVLQIFFEEG